jgi:hypothetical protein
LLENATEDQVDFALELVPAAVSRLRELSPVYARRHTALTGS